MDDYPYATLGADGWLRCDGLHRPGFPLLLRDVLRRFGYTGSPSYRGRLYREFGRGCCEVHVDVPPHPSDPSFSAWFTTATGDDLDDTLDRAAHQALTEFCERHLQDTAGTPVALLPIRDEGDPTWSERLAAACDPAHPTYHAGWAFTARYARHVSSLLREVTTVGEHQRVRLEAYDHQVEEKDNLIESVRKGNRELLQENRRLEMRNKELNDELMRTYRSRDVKTDLLDAARTRLQHAQDELTAAQSYVQHLETELHERDDQLEASQAQVEELVDAVHHLHELLPQDEEPEEEPEEDPDEVQGMSGIEDN